jgi:hypothetical protein
MHRPDPGFARAGAGPVGHTRVGSGRPRPRLLLALGTRPAIRHRSAAGMPARILVSRVRDLGIVEGAGAASGVDGGRDRSEIRRATSPGRLPATGDHGQAGVGWGIARRGAWLVASAMSAGFGTSQAAALVTTQSSPV